MFEATIDSQTDCPVALPNLKHLLCLIHPAIMKKFKFTKGGFVLVGDADSYIILKSWPCSATKLTSVMLPGYNLLKNCLSNNITVINFHGTTECAKEIVFTSKIHKDFMNFTSFKPFILNTIRNLYVRIGMSLNFNFCGYSFEMTVLKGVGLSSNTETCKMDDICDEMLNLKIGDELKENLKCDNQESSPNKLLCSTPVTNKKSLNKNNLKTLLNPATEFNILSKFFHVTDSTLINIDRPKKDKETYLSAIRFENIGGLSRQIKEIKHVLDSLNHIKIHDKFLMCQKSLLISGPQGTGKSLVVAAIQNEYELNFYSINASEILHRYDGYGETNLKNIFNKAVERSPSIIFIDNIDIVCNKNHKNSQDVINNLSALINELQNSFHDVFVIATTNKSHLLDPKLMKHNVLGKEIKFDIPSSSERKEILTKLLLPRKHALSEEQIMEISESSHGFTGADIEQLCKKAELLTSLRTVSLKDQKRHTLPRIDMKDMKACLKEITPKAVMEFNFEKPKVKWTDIGGMYEVKRAVIEMVEWPLTLAEQFAKFKITPSRGILMYGPPGCSKTMIAKALVSESDINFIPIKGPQLFNKYVGESELAVSELFKKARDAAPCIIFFDEIDSLASKRGCTTGNSNVGDRVLTQLLTEIDGIDVLKGVSIIAATNRPDMIDPSLLRPGRFDRRIYVPLPDELTRKEIFEVKLSKMPIAKDVDISHLVNSTDGYSGAEIEDICLQAVYQLCPWKFPSEDIPNLNLDMSHFKAALHVVKPRTTSETIKFYDNFNTKNNNA